MVDSRLGTDYFDELNELAEKEKKRLDKIRKQFVGVSLRCRKYIWDKRTLKTIFKMRYFWPVYYMLHRRR